MTKRKVVGITCSSDVIGDWRLPMDYVRTAYAKSCERAGLLPILLPVTEDDAVRVGQLDLIDGLLLSGGVDVDPKWYGEGNVVHPATETPDDRRDAHEIALIREAIVRDMPILAICRGLQILNVALGGTLIQDLPSEVGAEWTHRQRSHSSEKTHCARVEQGSRLASIVGVENLPINSHHHQAADVPAPGLIVTARADDGVIEALEKPDAKFTVAVQWHPENLSETDAPSRDLFAAFAAALS
jgi:putative glutamine amidotransferase